MHGTPGRRGTVDRPTRWPSRGDSRTTSAPGNPPWSRTATSTSDRSTRRPRSPASTLRPVRNGGGPTWVTAVACGSPSRPLRSPATSYSRDSANCCSGSSERPATFGGNGSSTRIRTRRSSPTEPGTLLSKGVGRSSPSTRRRVTPSGNETSGSGVLGRSPSRTGPSTPLRTERTTRGRSSALDAATGEERWRYTAHQPLAGAPAVADETVFVGDARGCHAVATDGERRWRFQGRPLQDHEWHNWSYEGSSPAVADGTVYIGAADERVYALDAETGAKRWEFWT